MTITFDLKFENEEFRFTQTIDTGGAAQVPSGQPMAQNTLKASFAESTAPTPAESGTGGGPSGSDEEMKGTGDSDSSPNPVTIVGPFIFLLPRKVKGEKVHESV